MEALHKQAASLHKNPYLIQCMPMKDKGNCLSYNVTKIREYADNCGVNWHGKLKDNLCDELSKKYKEEDEKDLKASEELRKELNRGYYNMYFWNDYERANWLMKKLFGGEYKAHVKKKEEFISMYVSIYGDLDSASLAENAYHVVDALYHYGEAVKKMGSLLRLNREIKVEKNFKKARADLSQNLANMIDEYTQKILTLIMLLKEGSHSKEYLKYLSEHEFDIKEYHEFTLYGQDIYAKVVNVHDGDTFTCVLQVNNTFYKWNVRTFGYDAYEITSKNKVKRERAQMAKKIMEDLILGKIIMLRALPKTDKYGRILANVYMYTKDIPKNFDFTPRYKEILTGISEGEEEVQLKIEAAVPQLSLMPTPAKKGKGKGKGKISLKTKPIESIPVGSFKGLLKEYDLPDHPDLLYINQLILDLGLGIPYMGGHKEL